MPDDTTSRIFSVLIAVWGSIIGCMPTANELLVYLSIVIAVCRLAIDGPRAWEQAKGWVKR